MCFSHGLTPENQDSCAESRCCCLTNEEEEEEEDSDVMQQCHLVKVRGGRSPLGCSYSASVEVKLHTWCGFPLNWNTVCSANTGSSIGHKPELMLADLRQRIQEKEEMFDLQELLGEYRSLFSLWEARVSRLFISKAGNVCCS